MLVNGFLTVLGLVRNDLGRILEGTKSADFEQKAWAMPMVLIMADFGECQKSSQTP